MLSWMISSLCITKLLERFAPLVFLAGCGREGKKRSKDTWQSNTGYLAIYPWIHCKVSLDTFSGQFFASLFLLSPDAFSHHKLNQLAVLQKPY